MPAASRLPPLLLSLPLVVGLSACAAAGESGVAWRISVKLPAAEVDGAKLAQRAADTAGVSVRHLAAISPEWHSLQLGCTDDAACREAFARLQADKRNFLVVERDERRRAHASSPS
jgi:hypothetical protein